MTTPAERAEALIAELEPEFRRLMREASIAYWNAACRDEPDYAALTGRFYHSLDSRADPLPPSISNHKI